MHKSLVAVGAAAMIGAACEGKTSPPLSSAATPSPATQAAPAAAPVAAPAAAETPKAEKRAKKGAKVAKKTAKATKVAKNIERTVDEKSTGEGPPDSFSARQK